MMTQQEIKRIKTAGTTLLQSEPIMLNAGPLTVQYLDGYLRYISFGKTELVRQIYAAVRDENWATVPGEISELAINRKSDSFEIRFQSLHEEGSIRFCWDALISGTTKGKIVFRFDGEALSTFKRNRIGFCFLHPMDAAGRKCIVAHTDGLQETSSFPELIAPHQPFLDIKSITWDAGSNIQCKAEFSGDVFEMEDQRNWTDASFKTYCTPLAFPFPVTVEKGAVIQQEIVVSAEAAAGLSSAGGTFPENHASIDINLSETSSVSLPKLGFCISDEILRFSDRERSLLQSVKPDHFRYDLNTCNLPSEKSDGSALFQKALKESEICNVPMEIALHLGDQPETELQEMVHILTSNIEKGKGSSLAKIPCFAVFKEGEKSTDKKWIQLAADRVKPVLPNAEIVTGTDAFFTELNRGRPDTKFADGIVYSLNPQVHAFDNNSIVETLAAQEVTVRTADSFGGGLPVHVGPVTFKMRWNPNATTKAPPVPAGELPPQVDTRQMSLFGAGWTVGSIKYLSKGGASSVTYYEACGWKGLMEREGGPQLPDRFPSSPGSVFPVYHVFRWLTDFRDGKVLNLESSMPLVADGLAIQKGNKVLVLLANYSGKSRKCRLHGTGGKAFRFELNRDNYDEASKQPETAFPGKGESCAVGNNGELELTLSPYGITCVTINR